MVVSDPTRPKPVVLIIDDEPGVRESLRVLLEEVYEVIEAEAGTKGVEVLHSRRVDVVLLDVCMPGPPGPTFLPQILALDDAVAVIIITAVKDVRTAVEAIKGGAYDYVTKPFDVDEMLALVGQAASQRVLEREVRYLRAELDRAHGFDALIGRHPSMVRLYELISQVAQTPATVLIGAESGTGKELVARAIHRQSPRRDQPFVAVNLAAIPDTLVESELFGHEKGAFTGAHSRKLGKFELAHGGTIFLDEVGSMRVDLQAKLLRVLQEREIERLGGARPLPVDVRVIAATNVDLRQAVRARTFREDLFYRLNVVPLTIPPLRTRKEDIPSLVEHFLRKYSREFKKDVRGISRGALPALMAYDWPGNVRELENIIERSVALATRPVVRLDDLPVDLAIHEVGQRAGDVGSEPLPLREARDRFEQAYFLRALERENWNQSRAARCLGIHRNTLIARMAAWGIRRVEEAKDLPDAAAGEGT
ncbi:MAG TPA: sigma-54 dependent transcriptional regulator [Methylomirabilota bacterium]|jgi:two-component system response regulator AtoC|nr:sigma-54 dependent transcriptional regulator [Methylomirabilota bacterium]